MRKRTKRNYQHMYHLFIFVNVFSIEVSSTYDISLEKRNRQVTMTSAVTLSWPATLLKIMKYNTREFCNCLDVTIMYADIISINAINWCPPDALSWVSNHVHVPHGTLHLNGQLNNDPPLHHRKSPAFSIIEALIFNGVYTVIKWVSSLL